MCPIGLVLDKIFFPLGTCFYCAVSDKCTDYWHLVVCLVWNVCLKWLAQSTVHSQQLCSEAWVVGAWIQQMWRQPADLNGHVCRPAGLKCMPNSRFEWTWWSQTSPTPTSRTAGSVHSSPNQPSPHQPNTVVIVLKALWSAKGYSILINFLLEKKLEHFMFICVWN